MASEHEANEKAMLAMSLRRRNRTISQIALICIAKSAMSILAMSILLLAHLGAQVALQQGLILRVGRRKYGRLFPQMGWQYIHDQAR